MLHWQNNKHYVWQASMCGLRLVVITVLLITCNKDELGTSFSAHQAAAQESTESFTPENKTYDKLDILLVIDESGSMIDEHKSLSTRLDDLLSAISDSDWQVAITTTNPNSCLLTVIDKNTPDYKQAFTEALNIDNLVSSLQDFFIPFDARGGEQALYSAMRGLRGDCITARSYNKEELKKSASNFGAHNWPEITKLVSESSNGYYSICNKKKTWVRANSMLAVLIVTDADHQCSKHNQGCHITDFYFYLKSIRTPHSTGRVYGLLHTDMTKSGDDNPGSHKFLAWKDANGESLFDYYDSVHNTDYTEMLTKISQNLAAALKNNFTLQHKHDGGEASVTITTADGETQTLKEGQYNVEGNALSINITLPANTKEIKVTYSH